MNRVVAGGLLAAIALSAGAAEHDPAAPRPARHESSSDCESPRATTPAGSAGEAFLDSASPVRAQWRAGDEFEDLAPFGAAIGRARIVALDEQSHGSHEEALLKTRLLRYLHERLGFDVLVVESGFFDVGRLHEAVLAGASLDDRAPGNLFYMYSRTTEGRGWLRYIDATRDSVHPLEVVGMDSQHSGLLSQRELVQRLGEFLAARDSNVPASADWPGFVATVADLVALRHDRPQAARLAAFDRVSARLVTELAEPATNAASGVDSTGWWARVILSLQAQARALWADPVGPDRERAMGGNVLWLAEHQFPDRHLVVWGHAAHLVHDVFESGAPRSTGSVVRARLGSDYHLAHFTALAGRYLDDRTLQPRDIAPAARCSLEARLGERDVAALYLAPPRTAAPGAPVARTADYAPWDGLAGTGTNWESTFFIRASTPVEIER